ncbi:hypothetical protein CANARDRAFT_152743 [[Candida] arabinofermentans NRRL YB-2248]|uniref:Uncharacterized protein n=1 Tax=[Candida] arabinofermentans NRRL YB-2248 TaxID=983967 RepID=A0A1E4T143_9ASCO|nr:hypothetical protein CANARDRAFT_152743 [[Candida] arabinofermentans NRRL YB-2248]
MSMSDFRRIFKSTSLIPVHDLSEITNITEDNSTTDFLKNVTSSYTESEILFESPSRPIKKKVSKKQAAVLSTINRTTLLNLGNELHYEKEGYKEDMEPIQATKDNHPSPLKGKITENTNRISVPEAMFKLIPSTKNESPENKTQETVSKALSARSFTEQIKSLPETSKKPKSTLFSVSKANEQNFWEIEEEELSDNPPKKRKYGRKRGANKKQATHTVKRKRKSAKTKVAETKPSLSLSKNIENDIQKEQNIEEKMILDTLDQNKETRSEQPNFVDKKGLRKDESLGNIQSGANRGAKTKAKDKELGYITRATPEQEVLIEVQQSSPSAEDNIGAHHGRLLRFTDMTIQPSSSEPPQSFEGNILPPNDYKSSQQMNIITESLNDSISRPLLSHKSRLTSNSTPLNVSNIVENFPQEDRSLLIINKLKIFEEDLSDQINEMTDAVLGKKDMHLKSQLDGDVNKEADNMLDKGDVSASIYQALNSMLKRVVTRMQDVEAKLSARHQKIVSDVDSKFTELKELHHDKMRSFMLNTEKKLEEMMNSENDVACTIAKR